MRIFAFALIVLLALIALWASEHSAPNAGLPVVNADYRRCIRVDNGPLKPPPARLNARGHVSEIA